MEVTDFKRVLGIVCDCDSIEAQRMSERLGVDIICHAPDDEGMYLRLSEGVLSLVSSKQAMYGDFSRLIKRIRTNELNRELIVRAARVRDAQHPLTAVDATAGMGEDSFLLAASGFSVILYERDPVIALLLENALARARKDPQLSETAGRMTAVASDSVVELPLLQSPPDIVLLDPMFPERQKSALIKKKFQLLQKLEAPCSNEDELLSAALSCRPGKIIIKRPVNAAPLAGRKPDYAIKGKTIRYDCIVAENK